MSSKPSKTALKTSCDKLRSNLPISGNKKVKIKLPKKVVISKKWHQNCSHDAKSQSTGVINENKNIVKAKKATKSEPTVHRQTRTIDYCKKCGDTDDDITTAVSEYTGTSNFSKSNETARSAEKGYKRTKTTEKHKQTIEEYYKNENFEGFVKITDSKNVTKLKHGSENDNDFKEEKETVEEYYKNEKFQDLYDSMHEIDNGLRNLGTLDTITEVNEKQLSSKSAESIYIVEESEDESVKDLKDFRDKNYFECHSAKSRIKSKGSATSLREHKCSYRFYLNDRLFPVSLDNDYEDNIRCVECHLPLELSREGQVNGTIQAKVKLGGETQDMVLLLPVKEHLIVQQRRKEKKDKEVMYFGLIKLDQYGNSAFNRSLPSDSLALKYQKGYREFDVGSSYRYEKVEEGDVIVI